MCLQQRYSLQYLDFRLLLLDSYAASSYIHPEYIPLSKAPVRYLTLNSNVSIVSCATYQWKREQP